MTDTTTLSPEMLPEEEEGYDVYTRFEVHVGGIMQAGFDEREEAEAYLDKIDDGTSELQLIEVTETILEARNLEEEPP